MAREHDGHHTAPPSEDVHAHHRDEAPHVHHHDMDHHQDAEHVPHDDHAGHRGPHTDHAGHGADHSGHVERYRKLFWIMLALAIPVVAASEMFAMLLGYPLPAVPGLSWVSPLLGTLMYVWGGGPFLVGAVAEARARKPGMMLLIGLAITVAFVASMGASLGLLQHELDFWWELALLIVVMLLGHWIEMRSLAASASALDSLAALLPDEAEKLEGDSVVRLSPSALRLGDLVIVRPGGRVPADGEVVSGNAEVDESMITGESRPVARGEGDRVVAGTVALDGALRLRVNAVGDDTALAGIRRLVERAQQSKSRAQLLADRAAGWLFWYALAAAAVTVVAWSLLGVPEQALVRTITVLVIACPHALGLAIPLVVAIATERAARGGVLVTDRSALERMRTVDAVLFDKTGTLSKGEPAVTAILAEHGSEDELLRLAAAAEADSEHPLAAAITSAARDRGLAVPTASDFRTTAGSGVSATVDGAVVTVGGPRMLSEHDLRPLAGTEAWKADGATILHVLRGHRLLGAIALADELRPESREAVDALHARGIQVVMITGDAEQVAKRVANELGIRQVFAEVRPEDKSEKVRELQAKGLRVAMVGDGVNDAPALAQADVGIAIGAGTDVAIASAGVVLASSDPRSVLSVLALSERSYRKMQQNLWWAAGYNLLAVPLAAGVLASVGFLLPMSVGAILMSVSTVVVAVNAQLLRRMDLRPEASTRAVLGSRPAIEGAAA